MHVPRSTPPVFAKGKSGFKWRWWQGLRYRLFEGGEGEAVDGIPPKHG